jgi:hypothetical protein
MKAAAAWAEAKAIAAYRLNLRQARSFGREQQHFSLEPGSGLTVFGLDSFQARLQQHVQQQQLEPPATTPPVSNPVLVRMGEEYMAELNTCIELARYLRHTSGSSHQSRLRATFLRATAKLEGIMEEDDSSSIHSGSSGVEGLTRSGGSRSASPIDDSRSHAPDSRLRGRSDGKIIAFSPVAPPDALLKA